MYSVNLCVIATGNYRAFLPQLLASARRYFCPDFARRVHVWTDGEPVNDDLAITHQAVHEPWPGPTLHRYRTILADAELLATADYTYYVDVDARFSHWIGDEILGDLVAVDHPGYRGSSPSLLPFERRLESKCCVLPRAGTRYYAGGFQGGRTSTWLAAAKTMRGWLEDDERAGIIPAWHDESAWNKYLTLHPPALVLPADRYCWPEPADPPRIVMLHKNHAALRHKPVQEWSL